MCGYIPFTCGSPVAVRAIIGGPHLNVVTAVTANIKFVVLVFVAPAKLETITDLWSG